KIAVAIKGIEPRGLADSSRWSQRKRRPPDDGEEDRHPEGVQETGRLLILSLASTSCNSFRSGHPCRVLIFSRNDPVVYASLRPPATICQPSGLNAFADSRLEK